MNTVYPFWTITIFVVLLYAMSFVFSRIGLISKLNHRKFWNMLLLLTFLATALLGLFMVLKINYKLQFPFYEKLVAWHVEFGIGMAIIAFFHFSWHLRYYIQLFHPEKQVKKQLRPEPENDLDEKRLKLSALLLGSTSIIAQVILLREFLSVFSGNELVIGLVMANWMILTGLGGWLGKFPLRFRSSFSVVFTGLLFLSVFPFATAFLINFLKNIVFPVGALIGVFQIFFSSLILLTPFCLISGFLFTFIAKSFSEIRRQNEAGIVYGFESVGSVAGGLLSGLLFVSVLSSFESLLALFLLNGVILFLISIQNNKKVIVWLPLAVAGAAFVLLFFQPETRIRSFLYPNQEIEVSKDSPHGNIVITRREKMWSVYLNNNLLFDSENFMLNEEAVHFAMLQHPNPAKVLLVSGGLSGQIAELKKYKPERIDYVEDNQWLLALMKDSLAKMTDERIFVHATDPLRFIRRTQQKYDVTILNLPGPATMQANRFFTLEFYQFLKQKLSTDGVLSFGISSPPNYLNQEAVDLNSTLFVTLKKVFQHVLILPGEQNHFLASDGPLTTNIADCVQAKGIETRYVNPYYIDDALLKSRSETILSALDTGAQPNQNLKPVSYFQQLAYWLSQFESSYWLVGLGAAVLFLFFFLSGNTASQTMFVTGFSASGMEILLLFGLQVFFGNIYLLTSFVFAGFMLGLGLGSFFGKQFQEKNLLAVTQTTIGIFATVTGFSLFSGGIANLPEAIVYALFLLSTVLIGGLTGFQFSQASQSQHGDFAETSGKTYSFDLIGSAFGALAVSIFLVPKLGIVGSVWTLAGINLIFAGWLFLKTKVRI
jgi:spermidine synthase